MHGPILASALCLVFSVTASAAPPAASHQAKLEKVAKALATAGARHQAAHLEAIAWWNWELRRALKELLYFQYVRGTAFTQPCFPLDSTGKRIPICPKAKGDERYDFAFVDPREEANESGGNFLPSACPTFEATNNYCQKSGAPRRHELVIAPWTSGDPIFQPAQTSPVIQKKIADCQGRNEVSKDFLAAWLFNVEPSKTANQQEDPFGGVGDFSRIGYLARVAAIRARIDAHVKAIADTQTDLLLAEARAILRREGLRLTEMMLKEDTAPVRLEELTGRAHVSVEKFGTMSTLDRGDCTRSREVRTLPSFPFGLAVAKGGLPSYKVWLSGNVLGSPVAAEAEARVEKFEIGPTGDPLKLFLAPARASGKGEAEFFLPNPLVTASEADSALGGFTRSSHLGYLNGAGLTLDSWASGARLAGAISPWEASRYLGGCRPAAKPKLPPLTVLEPGDTKAIAAFRDRIGAMLGDPAEVRGYLLKALPDEKIDRFFLRMKMNGWLSLEELPDPYLQGEKRLAGYARRFGRSFTASPDTKKMRCEPRVGATAVAVPASAPEPLPEPVQPPR